MTTVGVIGLGYVGLPLAVAFAREGCEVIAVDVDSRKIEAMAAGESYIEDVPSELLAAGRRADPRDHALRASWRKADAVLICVPTPLTRNREPDLGPLIGRHARARRGAAGRPAGGARVDHLPGHDARAVAPLLEESGLAAGRDFHLAFSPERVDPGRTDFTLRNTPKVLGGLTEACAERAEELYGSSATSVVRVSTPEAAELTKLLENIFRSVNIALVNELAMLTDRMGIDIWEVVDAAATKPYGFMRFEPGPGHGRALPAGRPLLPELAGARVRHGDRVHRAGGQGQPADALPLRGEGAAGAQRQRACRSKARASRCSGVSYKPGVGDVRESPALKIISLLRSSARRSRYHDPHVPELPEFGLRACRSTRSLADADLALIVTAHPSVDHELIAPARAPAARPARGHARLEQRERREAVRRDS